MKNADLSSRINILKEPRDAALNQSIDLDLQLLQRIIVQTAEIASQVECPPPHPLDPLVLFNTGSQTDPP